MDGILPLYKPRGMTSHDCVDRLRKITRQRKIGHTGTLDPGAEGVLPVCLGKATKVVQYMTTDQKTYEAEITIGSSTETEDRDGEIIAEQKVEEPLSRNEILTALQKWTGPIEQTPPMYSAVKVKGKRLYEYARQGIEVERPKRQVTVFDMTLLDSDTEFAGESPSFRVRIRCSKGTYIRTLAVDIGQTLGYPAHMSSLLRTASGSFTLEDCLTFARIEELMQEGQLETELFPLDQGLAVLPALTVDKPSAEKIKNGAVLPLPKEMQEERFTVYNEKGRLLAVYIPHPNKPAFMKPEKVFIT
ncbi:MAG TPA: tRNA pseudouridine(55) synthase TruB [Bacillales bacterium]|nr:tRNA pseudouridine(55) synthase TruB [Bacillales bacterium]